TSIIPTTRPKNLDEQREDGHNQAKAAQARKHQGTRKQGAVGREYKPLGKKTQLLTPAKVSKRFHQNRTIVPSSHFRPMISFRDTTLSTFIGYHKTYLRGPSYPVPIFGL